MQVPCLETIAFAELGSVDVATVAARLAADVLTLVLPLLAVGVAGVLAMVGDSALVVFDFELLVAAAAFASDHPELSAAEWQQAALLAHAPGEG